MDIKQLEEYQSYYNKFHNIDVLQAAKEDVRQFLLIGVKNAMAKGTLAEKEIPEFVIEQPSDMAHGDFAANIALMGAKVFGMAPRAIAAAITDNLPPNDKFKIEIAGPGFINVFVANLHNEFVKAACVCGQDYGKTNYGNGEKINVEFVSANPTGPMHLGNARGAAIGDCLAACLEWSGYDVCREFYVNDAGNQIVKFGKSLTARYLQLVKGEDAVVFPEDGYQGEDIKVLAQEFFDMHGAAYAQKSEEELENDIVAYALPKNIAALKTDLLKYRVEYDKWFHESVLHENDDVKKVVDLLTQRGATYENEGAVWYKASEHGAEKDEVLVRANGIPTYFAADIAYHANKFERGFQQAIDIWGADHHGHVARMKGVLGALGYDENRLEIILMQFVQLVQGGQPVRMSKRTGKAITLTDLLDDVPIDSARFLFNMRDPGSTIDFDLDLAVSQDSENPVYYVQYAHARICSILRNLQQDGIECNWQTAFNSLHLLATDEEKALSRQVGMFATEICNAAKNRDPAKITRYCVEVANSFHKFYNACHVKGEEEKLMHARLALCTATKITLANALGMLKITVPEKM